MTGERREPSAWTARPAGADDVDALARLVTAYDRAGAGRPVTSRADVESEVAGPGAAAREHRVVTVASGDVLAWSWLHHRAAGRVVVGVVVNPALDDDPADAVAAGCFEWVAERARAVALSRGLEAIQLDSGAYAGHERQHRQLAAAGYAHARTWWQMSRPVSPAEAVPGALPAPKEGVVVRQVVGEHGRPDPTDLRRIHDILETAFTDHFNYHAETFEEFLDRQRRDPGHAWDHWWIAEVSGGEPAGALVASAVPDGSYVAYLGVTRAARGRGVAKSLLHAVLADAAARGRGRVGLEVDADSPTGATALYESVGFSVQYVTESWHRDLLVRRPLGDQGTPGDQGPRGDQGTRRAVS